ncbi:hypothetical protein K493DRAFT_65601 [Basidiobolus meristosporus CBS 931.73]|uniref:Uncharacterized protein n=1 Tax=Basidiobolus meristosporus CBS 931.73 TaxID=1314790 RepID=A0A1Y1XVH7_9FUNG|nr:hypothetical protein K493DRAFT_65601 [Basidiobolus meristosporus CBS 931.73]|eukprot:ORX89762.1 hypothetical protein K493DRAFT_65601 [Basidiobolus meristosporus CBS 931.73]
MYKSPPQTTYLTIQRLSGEETERYAVRDKFPGKKSLRLFCFALLFAACLGWMLRTNAEEPKEFVIVTGASANHFCPLQGFLYSLHNSLTFLPTSVRARVLVYDLGLSAEQRQQLSAIQGAGLFQELHTFNFTRYPGFWNITQSRGEYAWKAGILKEVADRRPGITLWMDSGDRVFPNFLMDVIEWLEEKGFYSPTSSGNVRRWTHPKLFDHFQDDLEKYGDERNCNGAFIGFNSHHPEVMDTLINPLFQCALDRSCIAPDGSNRLNHRQDQAVLTYLALRSNRRCSYEGLTGLLIHQDGDCKLQIQGRMRHQTPRILP